MQTARGGDPTLPRAELDLRAEEYKHESARHSSLSKDPVQYRSRDRRAWVYSQRSVNARPLTRPARFSQASQRAAASRGSARGSAGAVTLICMGPATARRDGWDAGLSTLISLGSGYV